MRVCYMHVPMCILHHSFYLHFFFHRDTVQYMYMLYTHSRM
jgi:hypothetical protein